MSEDSKRSNWQPVFLRFPPELRAQLEERARASERSLTAEVVFRLRNSLLSEASA
jgi:hypothetical protein